MKEIEGWLKGAPEFYIKVLNVDHASKQAYEVQDQIDIDFSSRSNSSQDLSVYVMDWMPGFWYDMLTFSVEEYDKPSSDFKFDIKAGFNTKYSIIKGLEIGASAEYTVKFEDKGEYCGKSYFSYYENPEKWIKFPNYGVEILLSEEQ